MKHLKKKIISYLTTFSKNKIILIFIFMFSLIFFTTNPNNIFADENLKEKITFIAFDINYEDEVDFSISKDILNQIVRIHTLNASETVILQPYGKNSYPFIDIKKDEIDEKINKFFTDLPVEDENQYSNHYLVISEAFTKIAELVDTTNSNFYMISNLRLSDLEESSEVKLKNLSDLYASSQITLNVMSLPSSRSPERSLFEGFSETTNGNFIDFDSSSTTSMIEFMKIFMDNPISILQTNLSSKPLSNFINIPPTVKKVSLGIYKENPQINISIINPDGIEIKPNLDYDFWDLERILFLDIANPQSGTWTIISSGESGRLEILTDTQNPLILETYGQKIFGIGSEIILEVGAYIDNQRLNIADAEMQVRIRDNRGIETIQIMNDLGNESDKFPLDGIYTAKLPPISDQSIVDVEYTLQWKNLSTPVKKNDQIKIEFFPEIEITRINDLNGKNNKEFLVTTFETKVNNYPYLVGLDEIEKKITSENNFSFKIDPVKIKDTDKSYIFNIYLSSDEKIKDTVFIDINLSTNYLEESYESITKKIKIDVNTKYIYIFGLRYYYLLVVLGIILLISLVVINNIRQTKITGFLIDIQNNVIVDFSTISRNIIIKFIYPKRINFSDIKQLPYRGGFFEFIDEKIYMEIHPIKDDPSIRINSLPADERNDITQSPWIGSAGKQVRFKRTVPYLDI
ncbi:hypothetical protein OAK52_00350 [Chloroflexi bacterium]|nr:hypothetical protein [Chloroflexota bacterium]